MNQLEGHPAEDLARLCFSKLRFLPIALKDALRREGLWDDLAQELYRVALEGWHQGKSAREMGGMATRELRAFLSAYGYRRYYRHRKSSFFKPETPLFAIGNGGEYLRERALARAEHVPNAHDGWDGLEEAILALLREHPEGLSQCEVNRALRRRAWAAAVSDQCARLVVRGVIREMARPKGRGRQPSPMLVGPPPAHGPSSFAERLGCEAENGLRVHRGGPFRPEASWKERASSIGWRPWAYPKCRPTRS